MKKLFAQYLLLHPPVHSSSSSSSSSAVSTSVPTAAEELRSCYREVPDIFFKPDFSLTSPQTFAILCGTGPDPTAKSQVKEFHLKII